ncbi:sigma-70 family RNA polymerase sigma factor (plasmid) [Lentzea sp. JNUCC 0626]|uniref:sigma-70 family RNA polymerase sigma factor n=1 Tax=Lentzea sp. JNUCC 0626 TaxID=3367513 RepID=UPI003749C8F8
MSGNAAGQEPNDPAGPSLLVLDDARSDAELMDAVRKGRLAAYGALFQRHLAAANNLARQLSRHQADAEELVSEAFAKVLDALRDGRGPDKAFRAYLLTALRHTAYDRTRRSKKIDLVEDVADVAPAALSVPFTDTAIAGLDRSLAAKAFAMLPERWQAVLWHTEIEGLSPAEVAPLLGLKANAVSALSYRARIGLRTAYLQAQLAAHVSQGCHATAEKLAAYLRGGLSNRDRTKVESHLDTCGRCTRHLSQLGELNVGIPA